jgi:hypothetical protein
MGEEDGAEREGRMPLGEKLNYGCVVLGSALVTVAALFFAYTVNCNSN